jgi:hypothetical protein
MSLHVRARAAPRAAPAARARPWYRCNRNGDVSWRPRLTPLRPRQQGKAMQQPHAACHAARQLEQLGAFGHLVAGGVEQLLPPRRRRARQWCAPSSWLPSPPGAGPWSRRRRPSRQTTPPCPAWGPSGARPRPGLSPAVGQQVDGDDLRRAQRGENMVRLALRIHGSARALAGKLQVDAVRPRWREHQARPLAASPSPTDRRRLPRRRANRSAAPWHLRRRQTQTQNGAAPARASASRRGG